MKIIIITLSILGLLLIALVLGFRLGVDFIQRFDFSIQYVPRGCAFYQDTHKGNSALVICGDGTWWFAEPVYKIWDNPL